MYELSFRMGHRYLTLVTDHYTQRITQRIIWAREGKSAETLKAFFAELGPERCTRIKAVSMDMNMNQAFISAVKECVPHAQIVFDRFHCYATTGEAEIHYQR